MSNLAAHQPRIARRIAPHQQQYAAGPNFEWLTGRLEFVPAANEWQIRYRDPAVAHDNLAGAIAVDDTRSLRGFREGDFVVVRGRVNQVRRETGNLEPRYNVATIRRLNQI